MANWYVSSVAYAAIAQYQNSTSYSVGNIVRQLATPTVGNERCFRCTTAGSSGSSEPTWVLTAGGTTSTVPQGGTAVFTEVTGNETWQSAGSWVAAAPHLQIIANARASAGSAFVDNIYVADNHAETWTTAQSWLNANSIYCVTVAGSSLPPASTSISRGATVATTGASSFTFGRNSYIYGIDFSIGSSTNDASFLFTQSGTTGSNYTFENCTWKINTTNTASGITIGTTTVQSRVILNNTTVEFGNASQGFGIVSSTAGPSLLTWINTPLNAVKGTNPTNLIRSGYPVATFQNLDLSGFTGNMVITSGGSNTFSGIITVSGCKLNASTVLASNLRLNNRLVDKLELDVSDSTSGASLHRIIRGLEAGNLVTDNIIYRTGGASQSNTNFSWKITASDSSSGPPNFRSHPVSPWILAWNSTVGSSVTLTVECLANKSALPNQGMIWSEVEYLNQSSDPMITAVQSQPLVIIPTSPSSNTVSTQAWGSAATARSNSQVVTFGTIRRVASNPNLVFFCTTAGTTAGSEPAGYATASAGDSVTDNTAVFRAARPFKVSQTFTPQKIGFIAIRLHYIDSQASGAVTDVYIDPMVTIT